MPVKLVYEFKQAFHDGAIVKMVIWRLPEPLPGSRHPCECWFAYCTMLTTSGTEPGLCTATGIL